MVEMEGEQLALLKNPAFEAEIYLQTALLNDAVGAALTQPDLTPFSPLVPAIETCIQLFYLLPPQPSQSSASMCDLEVVKCSLKVTWYVCHTHINVVSWTPLHRGPQTMVNLHREHCLHPSGHWMMRSCHLLRRRRRPYTLSEIHF